MSRNVGEAPSDCKANRKTEGKWDAHLRRGKMNEWGKRLYSEAPSTDEPVVPQAVSQMRDRQKARSGPTEFPPKRIVFRRYAAPVSDTPTHG